MSDHHNKPSRAGLPADIDDVTLAQLLRQRWGLAALLAVCMAAAGVVVLLLLKHSGT